jgi:two-component system nitrogen regulation response regulator NtrX
MVADSLITLEHLPKPYNPDAGPNAAPPAQALYQIQEWKAAKQIFEKQFIEYKLQENEHNISRTAKAMGVERSYLHRRIKKLEKEI